MTSETGRARSSGQGFSLVEVLVSVVILSTGIVAVLYSFDTSVSALAASRDRMRTDLVARQKLDDILWGGLPPSTDGELGGGDSDFHWQVRSKPASSRGPSGLNEVTVSAWREKSGGESLLVTRIRLDRSR